MIKEKLGKHDNSPQYMIMNIIFKKKKIFF